MCMTETIICRRTRSEGRKGYVGLFQFDWRLCVLYGLTFRFICDEICFLAVGDPEGGERGRMVTE